MDEDDYCAPGRHTWVSGLMYVHDEDVHGVNEARLAADQTPPECEACGKVYRNGDEWEED